MGTAIYKLSGKINFQVKKTHVPEGKSMCLSYCRDLVHLDCPQHGKSLSCVRTGETSRPRGQHPQVIKWHH
uniref:Uncharacterized protein n=1 Tax=Myotis myotis TaxID=51298 RepID=A0A7J7Z7X6_MYOMY|nr:hypothetical protein mMyoMyo1_016324 [Myotis myotis]